MEGPRTVESQQPAPPTAGIVANAAANATPNSAADEHHPYVPDEARLPEFTWGAVVAGALLGIVFGASSLYLVLKVGLTVSASIPVAVLSITLFRVLAKVFGLRSATILENNIVQTAGSAGESIAFGVGVTMPALMILGFEMDVGRVMVVAVLGGLLGIFMMIPLRRTYIVRQHRTLKYPEGTACADVLIVGEQGGATAKTVFAGFGVAAVYQFLLLGMNLWKETPSRAIAWFKGAVPSIEVNPALLGVGYIIGTRISCVMAGGGVLAWLVFAPAIHFFGDSLDKPLYPGKTKISRMSENELRDKYMLYIGTGAVAAGGVFSLMQAMPLIIGSLMGSVKDFRSARGRAAAASATSTQPAGQPVTQLTPRRTDQDLPLWLVGAGGMSLVLAIWATQPLHDYVFSWVPDLHMNLVGAALIVLFGFLFVTVSSRLTGEIGSSSNPISGMTVATLLLTCLIFYALGWTTADFRLAALSVAAIVCVAASNAGTTSQDLKTGYLVGATPRKQQWAIIIGAITSALVIGAILIVLNRASTVYTTRQLPQPAKPIDPANLTELERAPGDPTPYHVWRVREGEVSDVPAGKYLVNDAGKIKYLVDPGINGKVRQRDNGEAVQKFDAPKAVLMAQIVDGILNPKVTMPWVLVMLGVFIAVVLEMCGVSSLPFAVGVYLPLSTSTPILAGGLVRWVVDRRQRSVAGRKASEAESESSPGVLLSTGYIAGGTIAGVLVALMSFDSHLTDRLSQWQYRQIAVSQAPTLDEQLRDAASEDLRLSPESAKTHAAEIDEQAKEIRELNKAAFPRYAIVPAGTRIVLPDDSRTLVAEKSQLGDVAKDLLGSPGQASQLLDLNDKQLSFPKRLPAGTLLKVPQRNWPAMTAFAILCALLLAVGLRKPPAAT
ncbi:MAG TPA: oligopeptide transporter, OPT family [Pirellulales bacterium]|nr:oligopeptide transporter, OPT family [Pirellulales bacterium]